MKINTFLKITLVSIGLLFAFLNTCSTAIAAEPNVQTFSIVATSTSCDEIDLAMFPGDGSRRIVIASANAPVSAFPVDGVGYAAGTFFGSGSNLGNNNYVVYNQSGTSLTVTGLDGGIEYYFAVFEFNGSGGNSNYLLSNYPEANQIAYGFTMSISSTSGDLCRGDSVMLEAHGALQYQWTPAATLSSDTDSVVWAKPTSTIQYTVNGTDSVSGCTDEKDISITVYQLPNVTLGNFSDKCVNGALVNLSSGSPSGGTYSGVGVSNGKFNPSVAGVGTHQIYYTYADVHGCSSSDSSLITVVNTPNVQLASFNELCIDDSPFTLSGGTPSGGSYSGTGVSSGQFSPSVAGVGQHLIRYVYTSTAGCSDTAERTIQVHALPSVHFSTLSGVCLNTAPFTLTGGTPSGGTYTGNGITNNQFSPLVTGAGNFVLTYNYTDSFGCASTDTSALTVNTLPSVSFSPLPTVCQNTGPVALSGGNPTGGTYSGTGVGGGTFFTGIAGAGQHTITYTYSNAGNCSNTATQTITVNTIPHPDLGIDQTVCSNQFAHLTAGNYSSYYWNTGANTSAINVDTTGRGLGTFQFILTVTNQFSCANRDTILVTFDGCVGINDLPYSVNNSIRVFPNPSSSSFSLLTDKKTDVFVFNITGALVLKAENVPSIFNFGDDLSSGTYLIKIVNDQVETHGLIIKNQ